MAGMTEEKKNVLRNTKLLFLSKLRILQGVALDNSFMVYCYLFGVFLAQ